MLKQAANEIAVGLYLEKKISFGGIYECVNAAVEKINGSREPDLDEILNADEEARKFISCNYGF